MKDPAFSKNLYHVASSEAIQDFWNMDIDFSRGGGLYLKALVPGQRQADDHYRFVALCAGSEELQKVKRREIVDYINKYKDETKIKEVYGPLLENCCYSHVI